MSELNIDRSQKVLGRIVSTEDGMKIIICRENTEHRNKGKHDLE